MINKNIIKYIKKQTHCPICNNKTLLQYNNGNFYLNCFGGKNTINHLYSLITDQIVFNALKINVTAYNFYCYANLNKEGTGLITVYENPGKPIKYDKMGNIIDDSLYKVNINHPKEFYSFIHKNKGYDFVNKLIIFKPM